MEIINTCTCVGLDAKANVVQAEVYSDGVKLLAVNTSDRTAELETAENLICRKYIPLDGREGQTFSSPFAMKVGKPVSTIPEALLKENGEGQSVYQVTPMEMPQKPVEDSSFGR